MSKLSFVTNFKPEKEKTIAELADKAGVKLKLPCDGKGKCGKCTVQLGKGEWPEPTKAESKLLKQSELDDGIRLACCCIPKDDTTVKL